MSTRTPPLESKIVKKILDYLLSVGAVAYKTHGSPLVTRGTPDITGCYKGYYIAYEVKRDPSRKPSRLQLFQINRIRKAGGVAEVVWSLGQVQDSIMRLQDKIGE